MPGSGQTRPWGDVGPMSGLPLKVPLSSWPARARAFRGPGACRSRQSFAAARSRIVWACQRPFSYLPSIACLPATHRSRLSSIVCGSAHPKRRSGKYGKAALEKLGAWDGVKAKIAQAESVRAALLLVARGEAPLGIVYQTDAGSDPTVKIVGTFPENTHPPIIYPIALTKESNNPDAVAFLNFIRSAAARSAFQRQGFNVLTAST
jgi:molybdenum ABC transporter molybdate-binding protein